MFTVEEKLRILREYVTESCGYAGRPGDSPEVRAYLAVAARAYADVLKQMKGMGLA